MESSKVSYAILAALFGTASAVALAPVVASIYRSMDTIQKLDEKLAKEEAEYNAKQALRQAKIASLGPKPYCSGNPYLDETDEEYRRCKPWYDLERELDRE